jgi:hypothetical protein
MGLEAKIADSAMQLLIWFAFKSKLSGENWSFPNQKAKQID